MEELFLPAVFKSEQERKKKEKGKEKEKGKKGQQALSFSRHTAQMDL